MADTSEIIPAPPIAAQSNEPVGQHKEAENKSGGRNDDTNINNNDNNSSSPREDAPFDLEADISDDESDEVSLLVVDEEELASAIQEAGISIQVRSASRAASLGSRCILSSSHSNSARNLEHGTWFALSFSPTGRH